MTRSRILKLSILVLCLLAAGLLYYVRFSPAARLAAHVQKGDQYFQAGEYDNARLEYANVVRRDPRNILALERLGTIALVQGTPVQALPHLLRARELAPTDVRHKIRVVEALVTVGEFGSAWTEASKLVEESKADSATWINLADSTATPEQAKFVNDALQALSSRNPGQHYAAGVMSLLAKDQAAATNHFQSALAADPNLTRAHLRLADIHLGKRELERAGELIKTASTVAPLRSQDRLRYGEFLAQSSKLDEARAWANDIAAKVPDYLPVWTLLARIDFEQKNSDQALATLNKVFTRDPSNHEARLLEARIQISKKNLPAAIDLLEKLTRTYPRATLPKYELGRAYALANRRNDAKTELRRALEIQPGLVEPQLLLAELNLTASDAQAVVDGLAPLLARRPGFAPAQSLLADAYRLLKRPSDAAAIYRDMAKAAPNSVQPWISLGAVLREQGENDEARAAFEKALALEPNHLIAIGHLSEIDGAKQDYATALARVERLDPKTRDSAGAALLKARIHLAAQDFPKAEASFLKAIEVNPDSFLASQLLVQLYLKQNRTAEAKARLLEKLNRTPEDVASRMLLALLYDNTGEFENARAAYEEVLKKFPESSVVLNNLAYLLAEHLGQAQQAEVVARKSRALQPGEPAVADTLGWTLYRRGEFDAALALLQESAVQFSLRGEVPPEATYHLAMANAAMGNMEAARSSFAKALESSSDFKGKAEVPARLQFLGLFPVKGQGSTPDADIPLAQIQERVVREPGDPFLQLCLGKIAEASGKRPEAIAAYTRALELNPKLALAAALLARIHATPQARATAEEYARKARNLAPGDQKIAGIIGVAASRFGDLPWAYSLLQQASTDSSSSADLLFEMAQVAYRLGKRKEAATALERASKVETAPAPLKTAVQDYRHMLQLWESTPTDANDAEVAALLARDPKHLPARMVMGLRYEAKQNWNAAAELYEQILQEVPTFPLAQARLALVYLQSGKDLKQAHELASAAYKALPDEPLTVTTLAEACYHQKEYQRTADLLSQASRLAPLNASQLYLLGSSHFHAGNKAKSQEPLKQALQAGLKPEQSQEAERMLKASSL